MFWKKTAVEWLLVCLGNPGKAYETSRHNVGFLAADYLAGREHTPIRRVKYKALTAEMRLGGASVLVMKPQTYMNRSGQSVSEAARFYKIPPERVIVLVDDVALPAGKLRLRSKGSAGGHNGLKDIIAHLGTEEFPRIRIGVGGKPHPDYDLADWVLAPLKGEDLKQTLDTCKRAVEAAECLIQEGFDKAGQRFHA